MREGTIYRQAFNKCRHPAVSAISLYDTIAWRCDECGEVVALPTITWTGSRGVDINPTPAAGDRREGDNA